MNNYCNDSRIVMTLDAGGTNFVFCAISGNRYIIDPVRLPSAASDLDLCLDTLRRGFQQVIDQLPSAPSAISFAFPGPADYKNGVILDLPNLPAFRGGVPLAAYLEDTFHLPVFINNDGNLYAYGEALAGSLPAVNAQLETSGNPKRYQNLIGITLGTGFGCGVVIGGELLTGDNGLGGDVWVFSDKYAPEMIAEESVSLHAVKRMYSELSGTVDETLTPKDVCDIADGKREGDQAAARETWNRFGHGLGNVLSHAVTLIDGIICIGGGLSGAARYFVPAMMEEMRTPMKRYGQPSVPRLQMDIFNLDDAAELSDFLRSEQNEAVVPGSGRRVSYNGRMKVGVCISKIDTSFAINLGAYNYALNALDSAH